MYSRFIGRTLCRVPSRAFATNYVKQNAQDRYRDLLQKKAQELGLSSVEELKETYKDKIQETKKELNAIDPLKELEAYERSQAEKLRKQKQSQADSKLRAIDASTPKLPYKTLASFVDVDKVRELPEKELKFIWRARFQNNDRAMSATMEAPKFGNMFANAFKNPNFILPLPKDEDAYEMHFVQWAFVGPHTTHCMLTSLEEYKLHKEYAKPHTTLMFHQELMENTGLVLMNGQVEKDVALAVDEAQLLVLNVQRFYGALNDSEGTQRKLALLRSFTSGDAKFDMDALINESASFE